MLKIGSLSFTLPAVQAALSGYSDRAMRVVARRWGAELAMAEVVLDQLVLLKGKLRDRMLAIGDDDHPIGGQLMGAEPDQFGRAAAELVDHGYDLVDINFGCPVRKVTKTGAGATLLADPARAEQIVAAVANAVDVPVTVKMRRGLEDGSLACLEVGPRLVAAGAQALTLHPRSARQMYTGEADHSVTALLVERVDVPVIASGDVTSRARAQAVLATTGCAAVMVGRGAQGNPWALREIVDGAGAEPTREEIVAELVLFARETVRELGERRATGFLKKFYGWYLGRGRFPRQFKQELLVLDDVWEIERRLLAAAPGAVELVAALEADHAVSEDVLLELPISIYGGG